MARCHSPRENGVKAEEKITRKMSRDGSGFQQESNGRIRRVNMARAEVRQISPLQSGVGAMKRMSTGMGSCEAAHHLPPLSRRSGLPQL